MGMHMIPTYKIPYRDGEIRIGWASWDDGSYTARSIKYAYPDGSGKISRGSPELPFDILLDMLLIAAEQNELKDLWRPGQTVSPKSLEALTPGELEAERKRVVATINTLQHIGAGFPWVEWLPIFDKIRIYYGSITEEIARRNTSAA